MKKNSVLAIGFIILVLIISACGTKDAAGKDGNSKGKTYTVATDSNFKPFEYLNPKTGELEGFDIEIIEEIADRAGFKVEFETMDFDGVVTGLQSGRYPIGIAGMSITEDRKKTIDFSNPYYDSGLILMVPEGSDIASIEDVDGKKIGSRQGSTSEAYLNNNTGAKVEAFPEIVTAYMDLEKGRLDATLYDLPNVLHYIAQEGDGNLTTTGEVLQGESYGIALTKDSDILDDVNKALDEMIEDGTYAELYEKYFGEQPAEKWLGKKE